MNTTVRRFTQDVFNQRNALFENIRRNGYGHSHTDAILNAVPVGKVMVTGLTWAGDLKPYLDATIAAVESLVTPLTIGPSPDSLRLGKVWVGNFHRQLTAARDEAGDVDVGEVLGALEQLAGAMNTDALTRLKRARDDASTAAHVAAERRPHDDMPNALASLRVDTTTEVRKMQRAADEMWRGKNSRHTATSNSSLPTAVRDANHRVLTAKTYMEQNAARSQLNREFWAARR